MDFWSRLPGQMAAALAHGITRNTNRLLAQFYTMRIHKEKPSVLNSTHQGLGISSLGRGSSLAHLRCGNGALQNHAGAISQYEVCRHLFKAPHFLCAAPQNAASMLLDTPCARTAQWHARGTALPSQNFRPDKPVGRAAATRTYGICV